MKFLRLRAFLLLLFTWSSFWLATAAPRPVVQTVTATIADEHNLAREACRSSEAAPRYIGLYPVGREQAQPRHAMGYIVTDSAWATQSPQDEGSLHAHLQHLREYTQSHPVFNEFGRYDIHAIRCSGHRPRSTDRIIRFYPSGLAEKKLCQLLLTSDDGNTTKELWRDSTNQQIYAKLDGFLADKPSWISYLGVDDGDPEDPSYDARGLIGMLPVLDQLRDRRCERRTRVYAAYLHKRLGGYQSVTHLHVTHWETEQTLMFFAVPEKGHDLLQPTLVAESTFLLPDGPDPRRAFIEEHLSNFTGSRFNFETHGASKGTIPAHNGGQRTMRICELELYAQHASKQMQDAGMPWRVVAAVHRAGDEDVRFHTPLTTRNYEELRTGAVPRFDELEAMMEKGRLVRLGGVWYHAELAALNESIVSKGGLGPGATLDNIAKGHVFGVNCDVCKKCRSTLAQLPVYFEGMGKLIHEGIKRVL